MWLEYPGLKFTENYFNVATPFFFAVSSLRKNKEITSNTYIQHQSVLHERTTTNIINLSTLSSNMGRKSVHLSVEEKRAKKAEALKMKRQLAKELDDLCQHPNGAAVFSHGVERDGYLADVRNGRVELRKPEPTIPEFGAANEDVQERTGVIVCVV